jgi:NAD-dependent dihydropyrimidine dehydrogenase PreA subunit
MNNFPEEYRAHVVDKKCPAHVCKNLMAYKIIKEKCVGCTLCARNCPVSCIHPSNEPAKPMVPGKPMPGKYAHEIDQTKCIKCGSCMSGCRFGAIVKE